MSSGPRRLILEVSMKGPCLVTGANGHVGYNLVQALVARGYEVRTTVRDRDKPDTAGPLREIPNVEVESLDVRDGEAFRQVAEGIDTLFHVAATYKYIFATEAEEDSMIRDSVEGARAASWPPRQTAARTAGRGGNSAGRPRSPSSIRSGIRWMRSSLSMRHRAIGGNDPAGIPSSVQRVNGSIQ